MNKEERIWSAAEFLGRNLYEFKSLKHKQERQNGQRMDQGKKSSQHKSHK